MTLLESLDLSMKSLTPNIPCSFSTLTFLSHSSLILQQLVRKHCNKQSIVHVKGPLNLRWLQRPLWYATACVPWRCCLSKPTSCSNWRRRRRQWWRAWRCIRNYKHRHGIRGGVLELFWHNDHQTVSKGCSLPFDRQDWWLGLGAVGSKVCKAEVQVEKNHMNCRRKLGWHVYYYSLRSYGPFH